MLTGTLAFGEVIVIGVKPHTDNVGVVVRLV
jgi:hypothetical protein